MNKVTNPEPNEGGSDAQAKALAKIVKALVRSRVDTASFDVATGGTHYWHTHLCVPAIYAPHVADQPNASVRALQRLRTFQGWGSNWDAEGAPAPSSDALNLASIILGHLNTYPLVPTAMLDAKGQPLLLLKYEGGEGEISVVGPESLEFVLDLPGDEPEAEVDLEMPGTTLPPHLQETLRKVFSKAGA
ncbi:hypothetical protein [Brevundimonas sp.]|uniref:hypothetical protein n=1 Tax=Brevundimonas sp. TaxID=1871086 RepID=UPI00286CC0FC|nr:hypothetical protein [Brevundimonas sp.]